jgi:chemotaxis protein histidine kinase CheA
MKALKAPKWGAIALSLMVLSPTFYQDSHAHFNQEISKSSKSNFRKIASDEEADDLDAKIEAVNTAKEKVAAAEAKVSKAKVKGLKEKKETFSGEVTTLEKEIKEIEEVQISEIQTRKEAKEKEAELAAKKEQLEVKKAQLEKARAYLEQAEKDLATAKEELEAANKELADAKENLTNKKKVTDLEEETNRQMKEIDVLKCGSSYQLASNMANYFKDYAQLPFLRLLLNMNAMMSALTLEARYDALFYNHNIGQIPNINTLLGQPQTITINNYNYNYNYNYSGDFSSHNTTTPAGEDLEEMLISANKNRSNPFDRENFAKVQFYNFDKRNRVLDSSRTNYDFSNFSGAEDREILPQNELDINTIETSLDDMFDDFA